MSDIRLAEPRPQQPQAAPDGNGVASLVFGILGLTVIPFIGAILAVILGRMSTRDARVRGERPSPMATAGTVLGWIGLIPVAVFVILFFTGGPWPGFVAIVALGLAISVLVIYYLRRNNRR